MGGAASTPRNVANKLKKSEEDIVKLMLPVYFIPIPIELSERSLASETWQMILDDKSPEFLEKRGTPGFSYSSCVTFFYDTFYTRLFDIHPMARYLFKSGMRSQGKFLVQMISLSLSELADPAKFDKTLTKLAEVHYERGVKAVEYGVVGEVLFYVLRLCLGPLVYTYDVHRAWVKVYSRMLKIIVPVAISYEIKSGPKLQEKRFGARNSSIFTENNPGKQSSTVSGSDGDEDDNLKSEHLRVIAPALEKKS